MRLARDKVLWARELLGYGIEKLAEEAGVSKNSVLRAEHEGDIRPVTARKISAALGVQVADLLPERDALKAEAPSPSGRHDKEALQTVGSEREIRYDVLQTVGSEREIRWRVEVETIVREIIARSEEGEDKDALAQEAVKRIARLAA